MSKGLAGHVLGLEECGLYIYADRITLVSAKGNPIENFFPTADMDIETLRKQLWEEIKDAVN